MIPMDRFKYVDPPEPKRIYTCPECYLGIYENQDIILIGVYGVLVHNYCFHEYAMKELESEYKIAGEE